MKEAIQQNLHWNGRDATFGVLVSTIPAILILLGYPEQGLPMLIGALPAVLVGVLPSRKARVKLVVIGVLLGICIMAGSFLAQWWWAAVSGIGLLSVCAAFAATKNQFGMLVITLCLPLVGIGMSYPGIQNSFGVSALIVVGSITSYIWSLCFKPYKPAASVDTSFLNKKAALDYGVRVGLAASTGAAIGFIFQVEHIGWIVGATLLVIRPVEDLQKLRSVGRVLSVFLGALLASLLLLLHLPLGLVAIIAASSLVLAAGLHASKWYITPAFTTFLVFWVLLYGEATVTAVNHRFIERILETCIGVGIAYLFGLLFPKLLKRKLV